MYLMKFHLPSFVTLPVERGGGKGIERWRKIKFKGVYVRVVVLGYVGIL